MPPATRIHAIDIFRGLTILTMVWVNDLFFIGDIPAWMKHMPTEVDGMTFVDVVFPAFLFIVGMSIHFAAAARGESGTGSLRFWQHVGIRTLGLLVIGVFMVNSEEMNPDLMRVPRALWDGLLYLAVVLLWNQYPRDADPTRQRLFTGLRLLGILLLLMLAMLYRKGSPEAPSGMTPSWWGILGLIGWAYLYATLVYMLARQNPTALVAALALCIGLVLGLKSPTLPLPAWLGWLRGQAGHLAHTALVLAGTIAALGVRDRQGRAAIGYLLLLAVLLAIGGFALRPFFGISKNLATPAWVLYCAAICSALFAGVYWLTDLRSWQRWAAWLQPAGRNPLLTYILPPAFYGIVGSSYLPAAWEQGVPGILRAVVFTALVLLVSGLLTQRGVRLHL
ncbi:MAG: hypothetical protein OHK0039_10930 [Bacteroidia bacterium]